MSQTDPLLPALAELVGADGVRSGEAIALLDPGWHPDNLGAGLVVYPRSVEEVAAVVALCHRSRRAVVPHGGLSGLAGGAVSRPGEVALSLRRLDRVLALDPAGATLLAVQAAVAAHGLDPGIDLAARGSATIGGLIATNAGGIRAFRHGTMRQRVLGLETVLADGTVYSDLAGVLKNNTGYDLKQLFIGAEGTLGIVTRAVLRLEPLQAPAATALLGLPGFDAALALCARLRREHPARLLAVELMERGYFASAERALAAHQGAVGIADCPLYLLIELAADGALDVPEAFAALLGAALDQGLVTDCVLAQSETQRAALWRLREDSDAPGREFADRLHFDVSLPLAQIGPYLGRLRAGLDGLAPGIAVLAYGHFLDGNLHLTLGADEPLVPRHEAVEACVYASLAGLGGSISAEHGIGLDKKAALAAHAPPGKLELMRRIKRALDPEALMNPGKILDTPV